MISIIAMAMMYSKDKVFEELASVPGVLFDSAGGVENHLLPSSSVNFSTYTEKFKTARSSYQNDETMYQHNNTRGDYMQSMAGSITESSPTFGTVVYVEPTNNPQSKQLSKSGKTDLALNTLPKFINGKKLDLSSGASATGTTASDAVAESEPFASQVIQKSNTDVAPSGDPVDNSIPVGDGGWLLAVMLLAYTWYKHSSRYAKDIILKNEQ